MEDQVKLTDILETLIQCFHNYLGVSFPPYCTYLDQVEDA